MRALLRIKIKIPYYIMMKSLSTLAANLHKPGSGQQYTVYVSPYQSYFQVGTLSSVTAQDHSVKGNIKDFNLFI